MKSVAYVCALDMPIGNGRTAESGLIEILRDNKTLENYFKQVATGNPTAPQGTNIDPTLLTEIASHYSPEATAGCKNDA